MALTFLALLWRVLRSKQRTVAALELVTFALCVLPMSERVAVVLQLVDAGVLPADRGAFAPTPKGAVH